MPATAIIISRGPRAKVLRRRASRTSEATVLVENRRLTFAFSGE
ncbi:MAG: hypothetical protein WA208_03705 [Thermoanaerobaculia bacterium]